MPYRFFTRRSKESVRPVALVQGTSLDTISTQPKIFKTKKIMTEFRHSNNLKIQWFSIEKNDFLFSFLGKLNGSETSIRVDLVSRAKPDLKKSLHCWISKVPTSIL